MRTGHGRSMAGARRSKMKIVSWNVNGLRASLKNAGTSLKGLLDRLDADVICFQETKAQSQSWLFFPVALLMFTIAGDQLDSSVYMAEGYNAYFSFCKTKSGYSGEYRAQHGFIVGQVATLYLVCKKVLPFTCGLLCIKISLWSRSLIVTHGLY